MEMYVHFWSQVHSDSINQSAQLRTSEHEAVMLQMESNTYQSWFCRSMTAMVMSSWQFLLLPGYRPLSSSTLLPQAYPHRPSTLSSSPPTQGLSSSLISSQQVLLRSISFPFISASRTSLLERTSQSPSLASTMNLCAGVILNQLTSGSHQRYGPWKGPYPLQRCYFLRQQSPRVRVGCSLPLRQKQLLLSSEMMSSSFPFHFSLILSLQALLLTDSRSLVFWERQVSPSASINIPIESPAFPMYTLSSCTMAVIPQAPTLLSFLLPSLRCCSYISKKLSSSWRQLHTSESLRSSLTVFYLLLRCCFRYESMRLLIRSFEYYASSGPPWPSNMLTVYAFSAFSWSNTMLSSHGALAWYWTLLTLFSILFLCRWEAVEAYVSSHSRVSYSLQPSVSLAAFLSPGGSSYSRSGGRVADSREWRAELRRGFCFCMRFYGWLLELAILYVLLKVGISSLRTCRLLHIRNYYNPQLRSIISLNRSSRHQSYPPNINAFLARLLALNCHLSTRQRLRLSVWSCPVVYSLL